jgi:hypothetical protein
MWSTKTVVSKSANFISLKQFVHRAYLKNTAKECLTPAPKDSFGAGRRQVAS